jgi:mRNA interferase MazF
MPSTINYQHGEIVLVDFPYTTSGAGKSRPALVVLDSGDADVLLARVTTQSHNSPYDVHLIGWQQAGLLAPSIVRLDKLATLVKVRVRNRIGKLETHDLQSVADVWRQIAVAW